MHERTARESATTDARSGHPFLHITSIDADFLAILALAHL